MINCYDLQSAFRVSPAFNRCVLKVGIISSRELTIKTTEGENSAVQKHRPQQVAVIGIMMTEARY